MCKLYKKLSECDLCMKDEINEHWLHAILMLSFKGLDKCEPSHRTVSFFSHYQFS